MTMTDQMACRFDCCFVVVADDSVGQHPGRWSVDEHQRRTLLAFGLQVTLIFSDRAQDQPIDPTAGEGIDHDSFAAESLSELAAMTAVSLTVRYGLDSSIDCG